MLRLRTSREQNWPHPPVYSRFSVHLGKMLDSRQVTGADLRPYLRNIDVQWGKVNIQNLPEMDFDEEERWLGDIPAHWDIERAKNVFSVRDERSERGDEELLTVSHITGVTSRSEKEVYMFKADEMTGYKRCYPNDLVINTLWAWMGAMGVSPLAGIISPDYHVYESKGLLRPEFVELLCRSKPFVAEVNRWSKGVWSSRLRLYPENFFEMRLPIPPEDEQWEIVRAVEDEGKKSRELAAELRESMAMLKERRSALITAAVTGQIDLEEMAA